MALLTVNDLLKANAGSVASVLSLLSNYAGQQGNPQAGAGTLWSTRAYSGIDPGVWNWYNTVTDNGSKLNEKITSASNTEQNQTVYSPPSPATTGDRTLNVSSSSVPPGVDPVTYANFVKANPGITPNWQDIEIMKGANPGGVPGTTPTSSVVNSNVSAINNPSPVAGGAKAAAGTLDVSGVTANPPTTNLQPGMTGPEVKQLQDFLVSIGYMTAAEVATGPGIYGPKTTAAVQKLQQDLGVDNSSGPGYWGPRTMAALGGTGSQPSSQPTTQPPASTGGPILNAVTSDPTMADHFANVSAIPGAQEVLNGLEDVLNRAIESGKVVNPNIEITPAQIQQFLDQASTELSPYYQEKLGLLKNDLNVSVNRLIEDYSKGIDRAKEPFKQKLATQAEGEAQAGTTYSSGRVARENTTVNDANNALSDFTTTATRNLQDIGLNYEKSAGSDLARSLSIPALSTATATNRGINVGGTVTPYTPLGTVPLGEIGKEKATAIKTRASELESAYRQNRILDLSTLS